MITIQEFIQKLFIGRKSWNIAEVPIRNHPEGTTRAKIARMIVREDEVVAYAAQLAMGIVITRHNGALSAHYVRDDAFPGDIPPDGVFTVWRPILVSRAAEYIRNYCWREMSMEGIEYCDTPPPRREDKWDLLAKGTITVLCDNDPDIKYEPEEWPFTIYRLRSGKLRAECWGRKGDPASVGLILSTVRRLGIPNDLSCIGDYPRVDEHAGYRVIKYQGIPDEVVDELAGLAVIKKLLTQ